MRNLNNYIALAAILTVALSANFSTANAQCIETSADRENITTNQTKVAGSKTVNFNSNYKNIGYVNQGNGAKLTLNFSGNNNTYKEDTIRFSGDMTIEKISRGNNSLSKITFVITENSNITIKDITINNSSNIRFINYGNVSFENSFTMATNTIFVNNSAAAVMTFQEYTDFSNNSSTTVLYGNGGIINFKNGFQIQSQNKFCLTGSTQVITTSIGNDVANGIYIPASFSACIKYTSSARLNNTLTNGPGTLNISQAPGAGNASNTSNWGTAKVNKNSNTCSTILPVILTSFNANAAKYGVALDWATATEQNSSVFEIEKSADGSNFRTIGTVAAKGFSTVTNNYTYTDNTPVQEVTSYYRIKMIDKDGSYTYSSIKAVNASVTGSSNGLQVYAKHGNSNITASFVAVSGKAVIKVTDVMGRTVAYKNLSEGSTNITVPVLSVNGTCFVTLIDNNHQQTVQVVL